jgi:hypothetical protein
MEQIRNSQEEVYNADYTQVKKSLYLWKDLSVLYEMKTKVTETN